MLWLAGDPYYKAAAPVFLIASKIAGDQSISWDYILKEQVFETVKQTIIIIGALVAIMIGSDTVGFCGFIPTNALTFF